MNIFSLIVTSVLVVTHAYLYWNFRRILGGGYWQLAFFAIFAFMLILSFYRRRMAAQSEWLFLFDYYNYWLAFLIVATVGFFAADLVRVAAYIFDLISGYKIHYLLTAARTGKYVLFFCLLLYGWSLHEARAIGIAKVEIKTPLLPPGSDRLRIVALSDIHFASLVNATHLARMVDLANAQNPDITVLLGDIVDSDMTDKNREMELLQSLKGELGKFAVLGNHEVFTGLNHSADFLRASGFTLLRGEAVEAGGIVVAGVDDPYTRYRFDPVEALRDSDQNKFVLLLNHRPIIPEEALGRFDLQLSGHTHGGQIFPGHFFAKRFNGHSPGMTELPAGRSGEKHSRLYLTTGTGFWGPPARLFAPPEIVVVDLVRGD